ncbi:MAG: RsiV family protein [Bacteroidales bacterium]
MKKRLLISIGVVLAVILTSCNNEKNDIKVDFDSINIVKDFDAENSEGNIIGKANIKIDYTYPKSFSGKTTKETESNLQELTNIFNEIVLGDNSVYSAQEAVDNYIDNYYEHFISLIKDITSEVEVDNIINFSHSITDTVNVVNDTILTINLFVDNYEGGAHPVYVIYYKNINLKTLSYINEEDVFVEGYKEKLTEIIKKKLLETSFKEYRNDETTEEDIKGYFFDFDKIVPNNNFIILSDGIKYLYNFYEIAPYAAGVFEVYIPNSEIEGILK